MVRVAERLVPPVAPGLKITFTTQDPVVAARVAPAHALVPNEKSLALVPVMEVATLFTEVDVGLLSLTGCGALDVPMV